MRTAVDAKLAHPLVERTSQNRGTTHLPPAALIARRQPQARTPHFPYSNSLNSSSSVDRNGPAAMLPAGGRTHQIFSILTHRVFGRLPPDFFTCGAGADDNDCTRLCAERRRIDALRGGSLPCASGASP